MAREPSPSPSLSSGKHHRSPDADDPSASPKRCRRHRRRHRDVEDDGESPTAEANRSLDDDVEEGEILDDAMDVSAAPDLFGNHAHMNSDTDATKLHASQLSGHSSSRDERKSNHSARESERGIMSSEADDTKGYMASQKVSNLPQLTREKERKHKDVHHKSYPEDPHGKEQPRRSPSRHHNEDRARYHSRSRDADAEANGLRASTREDSDHDSNDRNSKLGRHATRNHEYERLRNRSHVVHDEVYDAQERYKHERRHINNPVDRDRRDRERSSSRSRSDRRESAHYIHDESREIERRSGSSRHKDHERRRDKSRDSYKESDRADSEHEREKRRDDRDRLWHRDLESGRQRNGEGKGRDNNIDKHKDSTHSKYNRSESDGRKHFSRSRERGKDAERRGQRSEGRKENSFKEEDEEEYKEKIEQELAMQEEDDPEKIKEEARRRKEAIMAKYRHQQLQKQQLESVPSSNEKEVGEMNRYETADLKDDSDSRFVACEEAEQKHDSSDAFVGEADFTVGKSPAHSDAPGTLGNQRTTGIAGLGEGTPKSERSADMFCDDIFGESPAGIRKLGKDDGLHIEKTVLHDNWDDAEGYYTYRFGELLDGRYEITATHGKGVFSTVARAKDLKAGKDDPEEVAIKIIRNNDTMYKAGKQEVSILEKLANADREDRRHCKFGRNIGLKLTAVRTYSKQLFIALKHLKNCKVLHCDIKPDNMLVNEAKNVLKLCDFGNAMFAGMNEVTPYLVSRFYRAPEIILGLAYDHPLDMWSVGCCLYELYTGKVLFPGPSNNDMLRLHMELKGPFPKKMLRKGAFTMQHFDQDLNFHATEEDPVTKKAVTRMILNIKPKDIGSLISNFPGDDPKMLSNFKDLLEKIFVLDPEKRITVSQALSHPFITGK
ncbi:hypothetical protein GUJ93_ZPchr0012g21032 [Zizania palustris]|uniref:Serine/threonine-protein kinase PRP4 homolog n=1 Tax=Zizania palustris TaxID=103762 RepID=A0A8J6BTV6_ZIZPA|nr:hypothetical protein GUJ93_ZPchr0012g21032 [Zizania palustris]